jgi:hypothetical protein
VQFAFNQFDAILDGVNCTVIIVPRSGHAVAMKLMAVAFQSDKLNLGAAESDADSESIRGSAGWVGNGDEILSQNLARPLVTCTARCALNPCNRSMQSERILWKHASVRARGFVASLAIGQTPRDSRLAAP